MKECPTCRRTYSDETLSFCLADGALLSASFDPQATLVLPTEPNICRIGDDTLKSGRRLTDSVAWIKTARILGRRPLIYFIVCLLAISLLTSGLIFISGLQDDAKMNGPTSDSSGSGPTSALPPDSRPDQETIRGVQKNNAPDLEQNDWKVTILATDHWHDTGIEIKRGYAVKIEATGSIYWSPPGRDMSSTVGPDGTRPPFPQEANSFPIPSAGMGSLIMRIGDGKYPVGADSIMVAKDEGTIQMMVNDNNLTDNSGQFTVQITRLTKTIPATNVRIKNPTGR